MRHSMQSSANLWRLSRRTLLLATAPLSLVACGSAKSPPSTPEVEDFFLDISIATEKDANSDIKGRGAPIFIRVYELKNDVTFQEADYFALQDQDKSILGADLLKVDAWMLTPGETRNIRRKADADARFIGVFAGYRDLPNSVWRRVQALPPALPTRWYRGLAAARKAPLAIQVQAHGLLLTEPVPAKR